MGVTFFEEIADIARLTHFVQADCLRETIWKQVGFMEHTCSLDGDAWCFDVHASCFRLTPGAATPCGAEAACESNFASLSRLTLAIVEGKTKHILAAVMQRHITRYIFV